MVAGPLRRSPPVTSDRKVVGGVRENGRQVVAVTGAIMIVPGECRDRVV